MVNLQAEDFAKQQIASICNTLNFNYTSIANLLAQYVNLLTFWQRKINLVSNADINNLYYRHIYNSLQLLPYISYINQDNTFNLQNIPLPTLNNVVVADIGSGAGFPALVLALFTPNVKYYLAEVNTKKCAFLSSAVANLQLNNVVVVNNKIENINLYCKPNVITARGVSSLTNLLSLTTSHIQNNFTALFLKATSLNAEENQAEKHNYTINVLPNVLPKHSNVNWQIASYTKQ